MLRMINERLIQSFITNHDLGKLILVNPEVHNSTVVLEKDLQSGKIEMSNRFVHSQYQDSKLPLGQYSDSEQIIHVAKMMGCTHYDPEIFEDEIEKAKYMRQLIDVALRRISS